MGAEKSNYSTNSVLSKVSNIQKSTNIVDLIKKNKEEEKREKVLKIYTSIGFGGLVIFTIYIFL